MTTSNEQKRSFVMSCWIAYRKKNGESRLTSWKSGLASLQVLLVE